VEHSNHGARHGTRLARILFSAVILFAGCSIPVSRGMIIPRDIAESPEHLVAKLDLLRPDMEIGLVFEVLGVKRKTPGVRELLTVEEKQRMLYGATQLIGTHRELELFRSLLGRHRIFEIRFRNLENRLTFDSAVSVLSTKAGSDFVSYIVFFDGKLVGPPIKPDNLYQEETTRTYISDLFASLFKTGVGRGVNQIGD
jgi:hypothetical protein